MGSPENGVCGFLLHAVPVPLPVVHTPPLRPLDADPGGLRSTRNGLSQPQWQPLRPQLGPPLRPRHDKIPAPGALSVSSQPQWRPPRAKQGPLSLPNWNPDRPRPFLPRPWHAHGALPAAVVTPKSITGTPIPAPTRHDPRPLPPGVSPPLALSQCRPLLHHRRAVSPTPKPGSRRGSRTSFTYCRQMKPKDK